MCAVEQQRQHYRGYQECFCFKYCTRQMYTCPHVAFPVKSLDDNVECQPITEQCRSRARGKICTSLHIWRYCYNLEHSQAAPTVDCSTVVDLL